MRILLFLFSISFTVSAQEKDSLPAPKVRQLGGVSITGRKPPVERKADRTVVNVDALLSSAGSNALEVLELSPGVKVDADIISLKGKQGVTVFIDGKPAYLQGTDLANYLKSLPAALLDRIEIMPNPPAGYDAAGNGGIINIILKKGKTKGFNGTLTTDNTQGRYARIAQSASLNYRSGRINVYGNFSNYNGTGYTDVTSERKHTGRSVSQTGVIKVNIDQLNSKIGADYSISSKTTAGAVFSHNYLHRTENGQPATLQSSASGPDTVISAENRSTRNSNNFTANVYFRKQYDSVGTTLSADLDHISFRQGNFFRNSSNVTPGSYFETLSGSLPFSISIYSLKSDYKRPFTGNSSLEAGFKTSFMQTDSRARYNSNLPEPALTQPFKYRENIHAAYLSYQGTFHRFGYQLGMRLEHTATKGTTGDTTFSRRYTNVFPTLFITYKSGEHLLNLAVSRRIERPGYADLNPFAAPRDRFTYDQGNPLLQPQFSSNAELSYTFLNAYTAAVFHNRLRNETETTIESIDNIFYRRPQNIGSRNISGFTLDVMLKPAHWWSVNPGLTYAITQTSTELYQGHIRFSADNWDLRLMQQFNFLQSWSAEINSGYSTPQAYTQFTQGATWHIHAGIGKKVLNNKGVIRLNVRDVAYTRVDRQDYDRIPGVSGYSLRRWDTRNITLFFSYRFSKGEKARPARETNAGEENRRLQQTE